MRSPLDWLVSGVPCGEGGARQIAQMLALGPGERGTLAQGDGGLVPT